MVMKLQAFYIKREECVLLKEKVSNSSLSLEEHEIYKVTISVQKGFSGKQILCINFNYRQPE